MALNLSRIKNLYPIPRKERKGEGFFTTTSTKIGDQVHPETKRNKRMIYLRYNAIGAWNIVIMLAIVKVQVRKNEASTADVQQQTPQKKQRNDYRLELFF